MPYGLLRGEAGGKAKEAYSQKIWLAMRVRLQSAALLQLRILRFGLLEDRDVGIGVFP